jgi:hypothetical protein
MSVGLLGSGLNSFQPLDSVSEVVVDDLTVVPAGDVEDGLGRPQTIGRALRPHDLHEGLGRLARGTRKDAVDLLKSAPPLGGHGGKEDRVSELALHRLSADARDLTGLVVGEPPSEGRCNEPVTFAKVVERFALVCWGYFGSLPWRATAVSGNGGFVSGSISVNACLG